LSSEKEYAYLKVPAGTELRSCVGLVLAGMATRAKVGVGGLEEAVKLLQGFHTDYAPSRFRFSLGHGGVLAEVEEPSDEPEGSRWRTVVELVS
jgi:putative transcriptional regulator